MLKFFKNIPFKAVPKFEKPGLRFFSSQSKNENVESLVIEPEDDLFMTWHKDEFKKLY